MTSSRHGGWCGHLKGPGGSCHPFCDLCQLCPSHSPQRLKTKERTPHFLVRWVGGAANVTACSGELDDAVPGNTLSAACSDVVSQRRASPPTPPPRQTQELYPLPPPRPAHRPKVPQTLPCLPYRSFHAPAFRCVTTAFATPPGTLAGAGRDSPARLVPPFSPHAVPLPRDSREV